MGLPLRLLLAIEKSSDLPDIYSLGSDAIDNTGDEIHMFEDDD